MEILEVMRKWKRILENYFTYRRTFILIIIVFGIILYLGPSVLRYLTSKPVPVEDVAEFCLNDRLSTFYLNSLDYNANIRHYPLREGEKGYLAFIGNGVFGVVVEKDSPLYIRNGRTLSLPVYWHPLLTVEGEFGSPNEGTVVNYLEGVIYKYQCYSSGVYVSYQFYAHRTLPSVLVQEVKVTNPSSQNLKLNLEQAQLANWPTAMTQTVNIQTLLGKQDYQVVTGMVQVPDSIQKVVAVSIVSRKVPRGLEVKARSSRTLEILTTLNYSDPIDKAKYTSRKDDVEKQAMEDMRVALSKPGDTLREAHINVWQNLWQTGLYISTSKAADALNGDAINATLYYVLSQVPALFYTEVTASESRQQLARTLTYADGCYAGYHTLESHSLWRDHTTLDTVNSMADQWLLTLEKQGCHNLLHAGASGVMQALVLSLGGLRFTNHHLEFRIHPRYLHRDYLFRRINYGNSTHVNISVSVQEDNRAVLYVALDRSDKYYYACDAMRDRMTAALRAVLFNYENSPHLTSPGCLDPPIQLGPLKKLFPVKLTEPLTAILYITHDKSHMEELRHAIHVKEVMDAPAHEHHVIALHKHGHHLGGLPTLFWVAISFLILVFHLFLFKLIYQEYCGSQDKYRTRYGKL